MFADKLTKLFSYLLRNLSRVLSTTMFGLHLECISKSSGLLRRKWKHKTSSKSCVCIARNRTNQDKKSIFDSLQMDGP